MSGVDEVLRRATEVAFVVAVTGTRARPPIPPPNALRPYLRFQKLPAAALGPVRRSVDGDGEFRARVAEVATEDLVGRAGWLWLHRPEGWEAELATLAAEAEAAAAAEGDERDERRARRRVDAAEQASARAAAEAATARTEAEAIRAELDAERRERRAAASTVERLERRITQLDVELTAARRRLSEAEACTTEAVDRARHAEHDLEGARARAVELARALEDAEVRAACLRPVAVPAPARTPEPSTSPATDGPLDRDRLAVVLERAASATAALAEALGDAASLVEPPPPPAPPEGPARALAPAPPPAPVARRTPRAPRPRRTPLALPGGIMGDSVSAAEHLVKADRVLLVIDGYNAAKLAWPGEPLAEQRQRLLDLVDELVMRHGTDTTVVFDGADVTPLPLGRRLARITFSPPGTAADDVIVDLVRRTPAERPVVVATNDRAVRSAARSGGANLVSSEQLLAVARR